MITLIDALRVPGLRDPKRILLILTIGSMTGVVFGAFAGVFFGNYMEQPRGTRPSELQELANLWRETVTDLRRFVPRLFKRSAG